MDLQLSQEVVFVAGGSRGIGKAIARAFLVEGARVAIAARDADGLHAAMAELSFAEDRLMACTCDVTSGEALVAARSRVEGQWEHPTVVVSCVGNGVGARGWKVDDVQWNSAMDINLNGSVHVAQTFIPGLLAQRTGSIVFIGSIAGWESISAPLHYSAAKAALIHYAKGLARELGPSGVRINVVAPGNVDVPGGTWARRKAADAAGVADMLAADVPLNRLGETEEIANVVAFLSSRRASFVTGACWVVDGGQTRSW